MEKPFRPTLEVVADALEILVWVDTPIYIPAPPVKPMKLANYEWYGPVDGNEALLRALWWFAESFGEIRIFVRRLAWVPLNYPCQVDGGEVFLAEQVLVETSDDAQVLCGYWVDLDDLGTLFELNDFGTSDFEVYQAQSLTLLGGVSYFEWWIRQWAVTGQIAKEPPSLANPASENNESNSPDKMRYKVHTFVPSLGAKVSFNDEGLSLASTLSLLSTEAVMHATGFSVFEEELELSEVFDSVNHQTDLKFVSQDWFNHGDLGHLSDISQMGEPLEGVDDRLLAPWGTFFFFDEDWNLRLSATKHRSDAKWKTVWRADRG